MSANLSTFAGLAVWLLRVDSDYIATQNADLVAFMEEDPPGLFDKAVDALCAGDMLAAVVHLNAAIERAAVPVDATEKGRRHLERVQFAARQRDDMRKTAMIARVLVLDAIKAEGAVA